MKLNNRRMKTYQQFVGESLLLEYDREKAVSALGKKFLSAVENDLGTRGVKPIEVLKNLERADPTPNKQYMQWLIRAFQNGSKSEDLLSRGRDSLEKFNKLLVHKKLKPEDRDISKVGSLKDLEDRLDGYEDIASQQADRGKYKEVFNDNEVRIVQPLDRTAACYYGQGTRWCTAAHNNNMFDEYKDGLYILIPKRPRHKGEKYQIHFGSDQYMDEHDGSVSAPGLAKRFPTAVKRLTELSFEPTPTRLINLWNSMDVNRKQLEEFMDRIISHPNDREKTFANDLITYATLTGKRDKRIERILLNRGNVYELISYAARVIKGRWPEAEPEIMKYCVANHITQAATAYASRAIGGRWPEFEQTLLDHARKVTTNEWPIRAMLVYAVNIIKDQWPEAEKILLDHGRKTGDIWSLVYYARRVIGEPWPEAEPIIYQDRRDPIAVEYNFFADRVSGM